MFMLLYSRRVCSTPNWNATALLKSFSEHARFDGKVHDEEAHLVSYYSARHM